MQKLFVGNLPFSTTQDELRKYFADWGRVHRVTLVCDENGASRGFAFVEMDNAELAIKELDDVDFQDRVLRVRLASPRGHWDE